MNTDKKIKELENQLEKIKIEHKHEINKDTYWRGVMIGLETSINILKEANEPTTEDNTSEANLTIPDVSKCFEKIKYFMNSISKKYYRNNNVIFKDMIVYRFSNDKNECENCELSVFNKIKINYINNIKTYKYLIKLKSDIIMSSYFDTHSGVDKNFHRYMNIEHIIEYNSDAYSNDEILLFKKYLSNILTITEYKEFEEIFKKIGIGKNHQHNELIAINNKILKIFKIDEKKEIIDELKNNIY